MLLLFGLCCLRDTAHALAVPGQRAPTAVHQISSRPLPVFRMADAGQLQPAPAPSGVRSDVTCVALAAPAATAMPEQAETVPPQDAEMTALLYEQAKQLQKARKFDTARAAFERLSRLAPADGRVWTSLVGLHKAARRYGEAEATLLSAIGHCPANAYLRQNLADLCRDRRRWKEASDPPAKRPLFSSVTQCAPPRPPPP